MSTAAAHHAPNYADRGPNIIACATVLVAVPTLTVLVRFWSRIVVSGVRFWLDDYMVFGTLICSHVYMATVFWGVSMGLGKLLDASREESRTYAPVRAFAEDLLRTDEFPHAPECSDAVRADLPGQAIGKAVALGIGITRGRLVGLYDGGSLEWVSSDCQVHPSEHQGHLS